MSLPTVFNGDIHSCRDQVSKLIEENKGVDTKLIAELSEMINSFSTKVFVPIEYAEALLESLGQLIETSGEEKMYNLLASSEQFITCMVDILEEFNSRLTTKGMSQHISSSSFTSHRCCELVLFILLGLVDNSKLVHSFANALSQSKVKSIMKTLGSILWHDHLYVTQVRIFFVWLLFLYPMLLQRVIKRS
jgi:hypothetical protein